MARIIKMAVVSLIFIVAFVALSGCSTTPYVKVGAGYKFDEPTMYWTNHDTGVVNKQDDPISARLEVGLEDGNWTYGVSHHSQWATGYPFNNEGEHYKTEVFIDYTYRFKL